MGIRAIDHRAWLSAISLACAVIAAFYGAAPMLDAALQAAGVNAFPLAFGQHSPIAAVGFFASGLGVLFLLRGYTAASLTSGTIVLLVGLIILLEIHSVGADTASDHAQNGAAMTAICLLITGCAILSRGLDRFLGENETILSVTLQAVLAGAGIVTLSAGFSEAPLATLWGRVTHLPLGHAAAFAIVGLGLLASTSAKTEYRRGKAHWLPLTVFIGALAVTVSIWQILDAGKPVLSNMPSADTVDFSKEALLVFGLIMAASLASAIAAAQRAHVAADKALAYAARFRQAERIANLFHWTTGPQIEQWDYASDNAAVFYGFPADGFIEDRAKFASIIHRGDRTHVLAQYEALNENPRPYVLEYRFIHPENGIRFCREVGEPIFDAKGNLLHFHGTTQDITEKRSTEAQLMQAKADADNANRAKTEFLAHMSHELRTPLNSIIGFSQIISNHVFGTIGNQKYEGYITVIERSALHLLSLINDVLDLTKVEAGSLELTETLLDTADLSREAVELVFGTADCRRIVYKIDPAADANRLFGDRRLVLQCLTNLLSNARKFTPEDGPITIDIHLATDCGFHIAVTDSGIGIAEDKLDLVMEPFSQVRAGVEHSTEGTGLGLAIVKRLVEQHGGEVAISSRLGDGTTVTLFFPQNRTIPVDCPVDCQEKRAATA